MNQVVKNIKTLTVYNNFSLSSNYEIIDINFKIIIDINFKIIILKFNKIIKIYYKCKILFLYNFYYKS